MVIVFDGDPKRSILLIQHRSEKENTMPDHLTCRAGNDAGDDGCEITQHQQADIDQADPGESAPPTDPILQKDLMQGRSYNTYTNKDVTPLQYRSVQTVFISHRSLDKPVAAAIAQLFEGIGVHYWFDRDDEDTQSASALGLQGDQALVRAIDRGIRHSTHILGILSESTRFSWWVPYEIGCARATGIPASFLVLNSLQKDPLPGFIRLCSLYWSLDELLRWAVCLLGGGIHSPLSGLSELLSESLRSVVPALPPEPSILELSRRAVEAIHQLHNVETQHLLELTSLDFDWLPTAGGFIRDIAYAPWHIINSAKLN